MIEVRDSSVRRDESQGVSAIWQKRRSLTERGYRRRGTVNPDGTPGTQAEDAVDCHISGALSVYMNL